MHRLVSFLTLSSCLLYAHLALAAGKPPIYRCTVRGTPVFSDTPCQVGEEADSGAPRPPGKSFALDSPRGFSPAGSNADPNPLSSRRISPPGAAQAECRLLDGRLKALGERTASGEEMSDRQGQLVRLRQRYRELGC